jgi:predicted nucleic acid-binding protein
MRLLLDTNILSRLCHPARPEDYALGEWFGEISREPEIFCLPEIVDYETRRGLLQVALQSGRSTIRSLRRLDELGDFLTYLPLSTPVMRHAALLWAKARFAGQPTGPSLDADVILAAQALEISGAVVTDNLRHFERFVPSYRWQDVPLS